MVSLQNAIVHQLLQILFYIRRKVLNNVTVQAWNVIRFYSHVTIIKTSELKSLCSLSIGQQWSVTDEHMMTTCTNCDDMSSSLQLLYYDDFEWNGWSKSETGILRSNIDNERREWPCYMMFHMVKLAFPWLFPRGAVCWSFKALCLFSVYTMLMLVGEKILPTLCLLEITWNNKGYPVKLVYKCMYVRVITRMINSLPMTWLVQWRNSITMVYVYEEYQKNYCLLGRYFGQFACNSKVFRPTNIVCNFISWWQLKFYS